MAKIPNRIQHNLDLWQTKKTADLLDVQKVEFEAA